jgi:hypothetical protein
MVVAGAQYCISLGPSAQWEIYGSQLQQVGRGPFSLINWFGEGTVPSNKMVERMNRSRPAIKWLCTVGTNKRYLCLFTA